MQFAVDPVADQRYMMMALALGRRGLGQVWPNPAVGCVLVKDGQLVGQGWTQPGGRPHAETEALAEAGDRARGATAYVTLEPCSHNGKTPPCADALHVAGIARVVIACEDPDPRVSGRGIDKLKASGIRVDVGMCQEAATHDLQGFLTRITAGRPLFSWKVASSLDGRIALADGQSQWITGLAARRQGHGLRANHDAILIGRGTAQADNPTLNTRLPGCEGRCPVRIVLDRQLKTAPESKLGETAKDIPTWFVTQEPGSRQQAWRDLGAEVIVVGEMSPFTIAKALGGRGLTRVLIEGGAQVAGQFMQAGLLDRVEWFRGHQILGGDALPALSDLALKSLGDARQYTRHAVRPLGSDSWERYVAV